MVKNVDANESIVEESQKSSKESFKLFAKKKEYSFSLEDLLPCESGLFVQDESLQK